MNFHSARLRPGVRTLCSPERMFNGICFNEAPRPTALSTALDLAFGVREVTPHVLTLGFRSASWWPDQTRMMKDGTQPFISSLAGFPWLTVQS